MDRTYERLDVHVGGDPPVESDTDTDELETDDAVVTTDDTGAQNHYEAVHWILHLQREGFYFQRKSEARDVFDGYRALVKAGVCDQSLETSLDEMWANTQAEDVQDFYAADGGDEVAGPSQGSRRGWGFRA